MFVFHLHMIKALVNVLGRVVCKEKCGASVSVTLVRLAGQHNEQRKTVSLTDQSSQFLFPDVLPGKYRLEVWCFVPRFVVLLDMFKHLCMWFKYMNAADTVMVFHLLRSNTPLQKLCPRQITGAGSKASLMWLLVQRMLKELNLFKRVIGSMLYLPMM